MRKLLISVTSLPVALSLLLLSGNAAAEPFVVGATGWKPPWEIDFRIYNAIPSSAWASSQDVLLPGEVRFVIDESCVIWSRVTASRKRCRATGVGGIGAPTDLGSFWQGSDTHGFNFGDKRNGVYFVPRGPDDQSAVIALAECEFGVKSADQCDIWFMNDGVPGGASAASDTPFTSFINPNGFLPGTALSGAQIPQVDSNAGSPLVTALPGAPARRNFQDVALHEVGHALGLYHTVEPGAALHEVPCDASIYPCPIMAARNGRATYWPQIDDFEGMRDAHGLKPRELEWSVWSIDDSGKLVLRSAWHPFVPAIHSETPPRISCRPDGGSRSESCVMAIGRPGTTPRIRALSLSHTGFTVTASPVTAGMGTRNAEHAIDIAFGDQDRYLAIAKRSSRDTAATAIVTYAGEVGSPSTTAKLHNKVGTTDGFFTHTEPRVSYHETACHFVAAWPERNGAVRIATFGLDGSLRDNLLTDVYTRTPVELACDAHLPTAEPNCRLYVKTNDGSDEDREQRWQTFQVPIENGGAGADECHSAMAFPDRGEIDLTSLQPSAGTWSEANISDALLIDTTTYGNGAEARDFGNGAYLLATDVSPYSHMMQNEAKVRIDRDGVSAGDVSVRTMSMTDTGAVGLSNTTSWGWNEAGGRLIAVRTAKMKD